MEFAIGGSPAEHQPSCGSEHSTPVRRSRVVVGPHPLSGIDVPRLYFTEVIGAWDNQWQKAALDADEGPPRCVRHIWRAAIVSAYIVVGWDVDHTCLGTKGDGRPGLAAVDTGAEFCRCVGTGLVRRVDVG